MPRFIEPKGQALGRFGKTKSKTSRRSANHNKKKKGRSRSLPPSVSSPTKKTTKTPDNLKEKETTAVKEASYIGGFILEGSDNPHHGGSHLLPPSSNAIPNTLPSRSILYHRGVAFDTRCGRIVTSTNADTATNDVDASVLVGDTTSSLQQWLATTQTRGVQPVLLTTTVVDPTRKSAVTLQSATSGRMRKVAYVSGLGIQTQHVCLLGNDRGTMRSSNIEAVPVDCKPTNTLFDASSCAIPNTLTAEITWEIFTEMVISQVQTAEASSSKVLSPFDIVIVGTDVSMFSDSSIEDHIAGLNKFVSKVSQLFHDDQISQIEIICVQTGSLIIQSDDMTNQEPSMHVKDDQAMAENEEDDKGDVSPANTSKATACREAIQLAMEEVAYPERGTPLNISLRCMDNSMLAFRHLTREWVRETIGPNRKVLLELPETADGTQCSIVFDACFRTFPYSMGSVEAETLLRDLDHVAAAKLSVVRTISFATLDAALLYGVPMRIETHLDNDVDRFRENQTLVRLLLQMLHDRGQTLLVRASSFDAHCGTTSKEDPLYVLMVQSEASSSAAPCSALLFHYANADDLLAESSTGIQVDASQDAATATASELLPNLAYMEYLDASLGGAGVGVFNPFLLDVDDAAACTMEPTEETKLDVDVDDNCSATNPTMNTISGPEAANKLTTVPSFDTVAADFRESSMEVETEDVPMTEDAMNDDPTDALEGAGQETMDHEEGMAGIDMDDL